MSFETLGGAVPRDWWHAIAIGFVAVLLCQIDLDPQTGALTAGSGLDDWLQGFSSINTSHAFVSLSAGLVRCWFIGIAAQMIGQVFTLFGHQAHHRVVQKRARAAMLSPLAQQQYLAASRIAAVFQGIGTVFVVASLYTALSVFEPNASVYHVLLVAGSLICAGSWLGLIPEKCVFLHYDLTFLGSVRPDKMREFDEC